VINGFYSSAAGMLGQLERQDAISNNLANVNTAGYKRTSISFSAFSRDLDAASRKASTTPPQQARCVLPVPFATQDSSMGVIQDTSNPTDLAINGPGYFAVGSRQRAEFTRNGNFRLDNSGNLVTNDGKPVLGQNGPVRITGNEWTIESDGSIQVDGQVVDRLLIESEITRAAQRQGVPTSVAQGKLEGSNVSVVEEMVSMITALRTYEANQKIMQAIDKTLEKIINLPGRNA